MKKSLFISIVALLVAIVALFKDYLPFSKPVEVAAPAPAPIDIEAVLKEHPEYVIGALEAHQEKVRAEMEAHAKALLKENEAAMVENNAPFQGPADAKVAVVEFFDYACGYCRRLFPELNQIVAKNSDVKFIYRPVAFVSPYSEYAARAALAANEQGKFVELHTALFTVQKALSETLVDELAEKAGIDVAKMKEDMKSEKIDAAFAANANIAEKAEIGGVPALILGGEMVEPFPSKIQEKIDAAK